MKKLIALLALVFTLSPVAASGFDIPLLTWERGRNQQVVLGGGATSASFIVQLEGNGVSPLTFAASKPNAAGYVVYSLDIPKDLPLGAYSISTEGTGSPRTVVAGIALVEAQTSTVVTSSLLDLTKIISLFIFLTSVMSTLRGRKYAELTFDSTQVKFTADNYGATAKGKFLERLAAAPYRLRVNGIIDLRQSLLRFLLIREGELLHRLSKEIYGLAPLLGILAGVIAAIETERNSGIALTPITVFVAIAILAIVDAYAGLFATVGFWSVQLLTGNVSSVRDVLVMTAVGLSWVGPSLFASLIRDAVTRDFSRGAKSESSLNFVGIVGSALVGSLTFYLGQSLVDSVIYTEKVSRTVSPNVIAIVGAAIAIRAVVADQVIKRESELESHTEDFYVARVSSPQTALLLTIAIFGFIYIWTEAAVTAVGTAIPFSIPFYLVFIQFGRRFPAIRWQRNVLLESAVVAALAFVAYRQISLQPLLNDQRGQLLLAVCAVPGLLHSIYSAICSSSENKEILSA
jgi:hypothetical protein